MPVKKIIEDIGRHIGRPSPESSVLKNVSHPTTSTQKVPVPLLPPILELKCSAPHATVSLEKGRKESVLASSATTESAVGVARDLNPFSFNGFIPSTGYNFTFPSNVPFPLDLDIELSIDTNTSNQSLDSEWNHFENTAQDSWFSQPASPTPFLLTNSFNESFELSCLPFSFDFVPDTSNDLNNLRPW